MATAALAGRAACVVGRLLISRHGGDMTGADATAWMDAKGGYNVDKSSTGEAVVGLLVSGFATLVGPSHDAIDAALWRQYQHDLQQPL
eukprot:5146681-Alexandrium_andersonii.AAC.1